MSWAPVRNIPGHLAHVDVGAGRPVVLLHGGLSTALETWRAVGPRLSERYRVIAPDLTCHGASGGGVDDLTHESIGEDVGSLLDELGVAPPWDVVGFSLGASVALQIALRRASHVSSLALIGTNIAPTSRTRVGARSLRPERIEADNPRFASLLEDRQPAWRPLASRLATLWESSPDLHPAELMVLPPFLLVVGDRDPWVPRGQIADVLDACPHSQALVVPDSDHFVLSRDPGAAVVVTAIEALFGAQVARPQ